MTILYTPIDIEFDMPKEQDIIDWFEEHKILDTDYWEYTQNRHTWCLVVSRQPHEDWRRYKVWQSWTNNRTAIDNPGLFFHPGFAEQFPGLANAISQLPFSQIGGGGFIKQMSEIPAHQDTDTGFDVTEPKRYLIYVTNPTHNTFYLEHQGKKYYPEIDNKYRCFAFNNNDVLHGAESPSATKILLSVTGIIDNTQHTKLINRSMLKFKDKVIKV